MYLYHYFEKCKGPFISITELPYEKAYGVLKDIQMNNPKLVNPNIEWFLKNRYDMENTVRECFIKKGGKPVRNAPIYMTLGPNIYMETWYNEPVCIKINIDEFDLNTVSFTYGDMFPVFNPKLDDGNEYRKQVYRYNEILNIIEKYGYPENIPYSIKDGVYPTKAPVNNYLKFIEAQIWSDDILNQYKEKWMNDNLK